MNKTIIVVGVVIFFFISWFTGFVTEINEDVDVNYGFHEKELITGDKAISGTLSIEENQKIWSTSPVKDKMLSLFPKFIEMKNFIDDNMEDSDFKTKLLNNIDSVNERYIGGELTQQSAKASLSKF